MTTDTPNADNPLAQVKAQMEKGQGSQNRARHKARLRAVQALYQYQLNPVSAVSLVKEFYDADYDMKKVDADYFQVLVHGVIEHSDALDADIEAFVSLPMTQLDPIEHTVLRLAAFELKQRLEIPKRVAINEGIDLAKTYGAADGHKFVNGVLDKLAKQLRPNES